MCDNMCVKTFWRLQSVGRFLKRFMPKQYNNDGLYHFVFSKPLFLKGISIDYSIILIRTRSSE